MRKAGPAPSLGPSCPLASGSFLGGRWRQRGHHLSMAEATRAWTSVVHGETADLTAQNHPPPAAAQLSNVHLVEATTQWVLWAAERVLIGPTHCFISFLKLPVGPLASASCHMSPPAGSPSLSEACTDPTRWASPKRGSLLQSPL